MTTTIHVGDCRNVLATMEPESVDAIITDPPYGLGFMGRDWDHEVPGVAFWEAMYRVMKPGAHLLSFGGSRTFHRIAVAIEDAGFEIRDTLMWIYGSGFPKSLDVSKAIDKKDGRFGWKSPNSGKYGGHGGGLGARPGNTYRTATFDVEIESPEAKQWQGWGTALKPAYEPIIMARKPLGEKSIARNVMKYGTGAINVDACRIGTTDTITNHSRGAAAAKSKGIYGDSTAQDTHQTAGQALGRWPANVLMDEDAARVLDAQAGERTSGKMKPTHTTAQRSVYGQNANGGYTTMETYGDSGGPSRFMYVAKATTAERNKGLDGMAEVRVRPGNHTDNRVWDIPGSRSTRRANHHPTVKPVALMQWLVRLVTPPNGIVLDPFMGSGSTGVACLREDVAFVGIELNEEYAEIARRRITADAPMFAAVEMVP